MVSNISDFLRRDPNIVGIGDQMANKQEDCHSAKWNKLASDVTLLFQKKKLEDMELDSLTTKVRSLRGEKNSTLVYDYYMNEILKKGMIALREIIKLKTGALLLEKLSQIWTDFYCIVLPMLQAIFDCVTPPNELSIRDITLASFRDIVVFKTKLDEALDAGLEVSPRIQQMLLVLQSVHDCSPQDARYVRLESLVMKVVYPYLSTCELRRGIDYQPETRKHVSRSRSFESSRLTEESKMRQLKRPFSIQE